MVVRALCYDLARTNMKPELDRDKIILIQLHCTVERSQITTLISFAARRGATPAIEQLNVEPQLVRGLFFISLSSSLITSAGTIQGRGEFKEIYVNTRK